MSKTISLEKDVEKAIWQAYKTAPERDVQKVSRQFSKDNDLPMLSIRDFLEDRVNKSNKFWKRFQIVSAAAALVALPFLYAVLSNKSKEPKPQDAEVITESQKSSVYQRGLKGRIFIGLPENRLEDRLIRELIQPKLEEISKGYDRLRITKLESRAFVRLIEHNASLNIYTNILEDVMKDFNYLGLEADYKIKQLKHLSELDKESAYKILWLTKELGDYIYSDLEFFKGNLKQTGQFNAEKGDNGKIVGKGNIHGSGNISYGKSLLFVRDKRKDKVDNHMAIYCEPLHHQLVPIREKLMNALFEFESTDTGIKYNQKQIQKVKRVTTIVDESIVHGVCHNWLKENLENFGFTQEDYLQETDQKEKLFTCKGVKIIRKFAAEMGRKELLNDYQENPMKYWDILREKVPEYKDLLK